MIGSKARWQWFKTCAHFASTALLIAGAAHAAPTDQTLEGRLKQVMAAEVRNGFSGVAFVSMKGRVLVYEAYGLADRKTKRAMSRDEVIDSGSLSKQVTAAAAMKLVSEGKLSLDDPLSKFFEDVPPDKADLTIRQLLSHSAGLESWVFADDFTPIPRQVWLEKVFAAKLIDAPGNAYHYSNDGITLVAMAVEKVSGQPFKTYVRETFFKPLGMTRSGWYDDAIFDDPKVKVATGYRNDKDDGAPNEWPGPYWALLGNGGILWNIPDMLKWHQAVHGDLLPAKYREQLFEPVVPDTEKALYPSESAPRFYALAWRRGTSLCGDTRISHTGTALSHHVDYRYYRDQDLVIYVASNKQERDYLGQDTFYARRAAEALSLALMADCRKK